MFGERFRNSLDQNVSSLIVGIAQCGSERMGILIRIPGLNWIDLDIEAEGNTQWRVMVEIPAKSGVAHNSELTLVASAALRWSWQWRRR